MTNGKPFSVGCMLFNDRSSTLAFLWVLAAGFPGGGGRFESPKGSTEKFRELKKLKSNCE